MNSIDIPSKFLTWSQRIPTKQNILSINTSSYNEPTKEKQKKPIMLYILITSKVTLLIFNEGYEYY